MESKSVKFTDVATFTDDYLKRITSNEAMAKFQQRDAIIHGRYYIDVTKLLDADGARELSNIILNLRERRDVISSFRTGEPIRMVMLSNGLLIALRRPLKTLNADELRIMDELHDLLNILI